MNSTTTIPQSPILTVLTALAFCFLPLISGKTETLHLDSRLGIDTAPGTAERPLQTLAQAAVMVNAKTEPGPMTIRLAPGIYLLPKQVVFANAHAFSRERRFILEAAVLPDDPEWRPASMPTILSIEDPRQPEQERHPTATYGLKVQMSHVTIRGLKFLGNPLPNNMHCPLECVAPNLTDVFVTQCMFLGDPNTLDIYCGVITDGHQFVVDHCVFVGCHGSTVFWDGDRGVVGKGNAMQYCIVDGAKISGVWTCDTDEDFEFHHNIVTRSEYFWMRKRGEQRTFHVRDCVVTENAHQSGYGVESGATGRTGAEVVFREENVVKKGEVVIEKNRKAKMYLHPIPGTLGSELGAGLFMSQPAGK